MPRGWRLRWLRVHDPILPYLTLSYPTLLYLPLPLTPPITNPTHLLYILYIPTYLPTYLLQESSLSLPWLTLSYPYP